MTIPTFNVDSDRPEDKKRYLITSGESQERFVLSEIDCAKESAERYIRQSLNIKNDPSLTVWVRLPYTTTVSNVTIGE